VESILNLEPQDCMCTRNGLFHAVENILNLEPQNRDGTRQGLFHASEQARRALEVVRMTVYRAVEVDGSCDRLG
jgi:hypothetical protein